MHRGVGGGTTAVRRVRPRWVQPMTIRPGCPRGMPAWGQVESGRSGIHQGEHWNLQLASICGRKAEFHSAARVPGLGSRAGSQFWRCTDPERVSNVWVGHRNHEGVQEPPSHATDLRDERLRRIDRSQRHVPKGVVGSDRGEVGSRGHGHLAESGVVSMRGVTHGLCQRREQGEVRGQYRRKR